MYVNKLTVVYENEKPKLRNFVGCEIENIKIKVLPGEGLTAMSNTKVDPWNFESDYPSPDNSHTIVYSDLEEMAIGAPLNGQCFLEFPNGRSIKLGGWCGGPPVWEPNGSRVALPLWKRKIFVGTVQQLAIIDVDALEMKIYNKTFNVLDVQSFTENIIKGCNTPLNKCEPVNLDLSKEKVCKIVDLKCGLR